ncbi:hypothetical protein TMEN_7080 [Trichophyton mentagrophytes]|nr:hypothetical protein TMEN_7080 [Trichophyton mentagrophytes]
MDVFIYMAQKSISSILIVVYLLDSFSIVGLPSGLAR